MAETLYRLSMPEPHTHLFSVELEVRNAREPLDLVLPSWTPGSYLLREYARHVQDFRAEDGEGGPLAWQKTDKNTWRVAAPRGGTVRAHYRVYANELTVRTSHLDASHGYVNGASVFMFVRGREAEPYAVEVAAPPGWRATSALRETDATGRFEAQNYDELVDSPIEIGTHEVLDFEVAGRSHRYAIWGRGNYDPDRLITDTTKIIQAALEMFGEPPYRTYTFILHLVPGGRGGLEHRDSCSLQVGRQAFQGKAYEDFLALVAHEFFHTWNGKRIRPAALGPFDYTRENYTRSLWVVEGLTTYYTDLLLRRAGIITPERYLERLGEAIARLQAVPGRQVQTLEDSSFDTWIKFYRPDEHTPNSQVSYYLKGALVGLLLDLRIRSATENGRSLDDVVLALWDRYGKLDIGFPESGEGGIEEIAQEVAGEDLSDFFAAHLRDTLELDYNAHLAAAGLRLTSAADAAAGGSGATTGSTTARTASPREGVGGALVLGMRLKEESGRTIVTHVLADTPAYRARINARDELVSLNGFRVNAGELAARLGAIQPGGSVQLTLFRRDELLTLPVETGSAPSAPTQISGVAAATPLQKAILRDWLRVEE